MISVFLKPPILEVIEDSVLKTSLLTALLFFNDNFFKWQYTHIKKVSIKEYSEKPSFPSKMNPPTLFPSRDIHPSFQYSRTLLKG